MAHLERILKRRRDVDEAELDDIRRVVLARLAVSNGETADHPPASERRPVVVRQIHGGTPGGAPYPVVGAETQAPSAWLLVAPLEDSGADSMASVEATPTFEPGVQAQTGGDVLYESSTSEEALREAHFDEGLVPPEALLTAADPRSEAADPAKPTVRLQSRDGQRPGRLAAKERRRAEPRSEMTVCCPYCAALLEQLPATDDRCPRCDQRLIVRSVGARVAILAEAVLPFFEAERHNEERWTADRQRWLELGRASGAPSDQAPALSGELISDGDVAGAQAWYMASVDQAYLVAERERRWEEAARIRYEQAGALSAIAGSSGPSDEIVGLQRDGLAADLRAIGEVARNAEVRGQWCCEACRADDHRVVEIAEELGSPTLPHEGCPDGLCRCRWFLTTRDQELFAALLRRQMGADRRTVQPPDEPRDDALSAIA